MKIAGFSGLSPVGHSFSDAYIFDREGQRPKVFVFLWVAFFFSFPKARQVGFSKLI